MTTTYGPLGEPEPCANCGKPTTDRINGAALHYAIHSALCLGQTPARKTEWLSTRSARPEPSKRGTTPQPTLRDQLATDYDAATVTRAVELWNENMRGIHYVGAHRTALAILNGSLAHRDVPELPKLSPGALAPLDDSPVWGARSWNVYPTVTFPRHGDLAAYDINGMYLSAAASEMGTGDPKHIKPSQARTANDAEWFTSPGYVRIAEHENVPWSIETRMEPDMWMPTPLMNELRRQGAAFQVSEFLVWTSHRRWLDPHVNLMRAARGVLMLLGDDPAAIAVLGIVKDIYTRMIGGLLRSEDHNHGAALRVDWSDMVIATAQARMFYNLAKVPPRYPVIGIHVDAAWFVLPRGQVHPPELAISDQLGKWKTAGRIPWTEDLIEAWQEDDHEMIREALSK